MIKLTARLLLPGLGVAGWLLVGIPACTREVAVEPDRVPAEQGDADARTRGQALLGVAYYHGHGVAQDFDEAARWARLAAEQGDAGAQVVLGLSYLNGTGVARDPVSAYAWLTLASSASGVAGARELRDRLAERMTPEQIAEAQARVRELER